jgi:hypothetical protein
MEKIHDDNKTKLLEEGQGHKDVSSKRISKEDTPKDKREVKEIDNRNITYKITYFNPSSCANEEVYTKMIK